MSGLGIVIWLSFLAAALLLAAGGIRYAQRDDSEELDSDRRLHGPRRRIERRGSGERRSLGRLLHDKLHNPGRRRTERREAERRHGDDWKEVIEDVKARIERVREDNQR